eukprot:CCRYP_012746-RA/>CCRYP_012746-RA protein AED:0.11 eAED:0.05 QI:0/0/0/1/0/0/2/0/143
MRELYLTWRLPPQFANKFWQVRDLVIAFNSHMASIFFSSWVICLDESMSTWFNRWTCPGWVYCPMKHHPFGNKYHTAGCAESGIMFAMELVEGKDRSQDLGSYEISRQLLNSSDLESIHVLLSRRDAFGHQEFMVMPWMSIWL